MKRTPFVSIITPCYNGQSYLHRYFQSILKQTYRNIELIFVDDCSTDKTKIIAENYKPKLEAKEIKVKIICLPKNVGVSGVVNVGLKRFTGAYLMFLDSDDIMYPNHIERKVCFLEQNKQYTWMACRINKVSHSKKIGILEVAHKKETENIFERLILSQNVCYNPILYMYKASCFLEVNPSRKIHNTRHGQNYQLLLPMAYRHKCAFLDEILGNYIVRANSLSRTINRPKELDRTNKREKMLIHTINNINGIGIMDRQKYINMVKRKYGKYGKYKGKDIKKVMLIGGTGVLSRDVAKQCIASGMGVWMINRGNKKSPEGAQVIIGDINKMTSGKLGNMKFDVVIDFLAYVPKQLEKHLKLFRDRCAQYIFISTATVYSNKKEKVLVTESKAVTNVDWSYSRNKIECERLLKKSYNVAAEYYTIVRPYITYGDTRIPYPFISRKSQWTLIHTILNGMTIPIWGSNLCTLTHTEDFARALVGLFTNKKARNEAFHITSDEYMTWYKALVLIGKAIGKAPKTIRIPAKEIEKMFLTMKGELTCDKSHTRIFNNAKIKDAVPGWKCHINFADGIKRTIQYFQDHPNMMRVSTAWEEKAESLINTWKER